MMPQEIINMVAELQSGRNDGWAEQGIRERLKEIRNYLNKVMIEDNLSGGLCPKVNTRLKVKMILGYDWAGDQQYADFIDAVCAKCSDQRRQFLICDKSNQKQKMSLVR